MRWKVNGFFCTLRKAFCREFFDLDRLKLIKARLIRLKTLYYNGVISCKITEIATVCLFLLAKVKKEGQETLSTLVSPMCNYYISCTEFCHPENETGKYLGKRVRYRYGLRGYR